MKRKLLVGILTDSPNISNWMFEVLKKLEKSSFCELVLMVQNDSIQVKNKFKKHYISEKYLEFDKKIFKSKKEAVDKKSMSAFLSIKKIIVKQEIIDEIYTFPNELLEKIKTFNLDLILDLGEAKLKVNSYEISKFGIWKFNLNVEKTRVLSFKKVINREREMSAYLLISLHDNSYNLIASELSTSVDNLSINRCLNRYFWKVSSILYRKIEELYTQGGKKFFERINDKNYIPNEEKIMLPNNSIAFFKLLKFNANRIKKILRSLIYRDQWILLYKFTDNNFVTNFQDFNKIFPPKDRIWADPHVIEKDNKYFIFIEELIFKENKGFISVIEMDYNGNYKNPVKVLEFDYHLSFPYIFKDNNEIYMIPESQKNGNIQLFKCVHFPYKWKLETVLMNNVNAVDTVLIKRKNKYYMFTSIKENEGESVNDELFLFTSDDLVSKKWKKHPNSPIVSDVKNARSAGKIFKNRENFYRTAQDCSDHYGYGIKINKILKLDEENYEEELTSSIFPNWDKNIVSTHSLTSSEGLVVADAEYVRNRFFN